MSLSREVLAVVEGLRRVAKKVHSQEDLWEVWRVAEHIAQALRDADPTFSETAFLEAVEVGGSYV